MPLDQMIEGIFCLCCLFACLSMIIPSIWHQCQWLYGLDSDLYTENSFFRFYWHVLNSSPSNDAEACFFLLFDAAAYLKNLLITQSMNEKY